jgi:hypothetical protein
MVQAYRDQCREAAHCGLPGLCKLWFNTLLDVAPTAYAEHLYACKRSQTMQPKNLLLLGFTLLAMVWVGYVDLVANEMQALVFFVLLVTFILGMLRPQAAWRWALVIGLSVTAAEFLALVWGFEPAGLAHSRAVHPGQALSFTFANVLESLMVLVPGLMGAYCGVAAYKLIFAWRKTV